MTELAHPVPGSIAPVPGTRNSGNQRGIRLVPGVPGVPGLTRPYAQTHNCFSHARINSHPRAYLMEHPEHPEQTNISAAIRCSGYPEQQTPTRNREQAMAETKPARPSLRDDMPLVSAFIDDMRAAFGTDTINQAIRNGMAGGCDFYAEEGGKRVGNQPALRGTIVSLSDMVITQPRPEKEDARRGR